MAFALTGVVLLTVTGTGAGVMLFALFDLTEQAKVCHAVPFPLSGFPAQ